MAWKEFLVNEREIPFVSLVNKEKNIPKNEELNNSDCEFDFKILTKPEDKYDLPELHRKLSGLDKIDYDNYFLIYVSFAESQRPGCEVKIKKIIQQQEEVIVEVVFYLPQREFALEVIDLPYDLIKVSKTKLLFKKELEFKFVTSQQKLLKQINFKLK